MECPVCEWSGSCKGYKQHLQSEKHIMMCEISKLKRQLRKMQKELDNANELLENNKILPPEPATPEVEEVEPKEVKKAKQYKKDKKDIINFLERLTPDNWSGICESNATDSIQIEKFKHVFRSDYDFDYKDTTWGVRFNEKKIIYGRVAPIGIQPAIEPALPDDELLKHKWYMTKSTREKFEKYINRHSEYEQILDIAENIHKSNWDELTLPVESDGDQLKKCKAMYRADFETYQYTTLQPVVYSDKTIKFIRPTKGCGYDGSETIFY